MNKRIVFEGEPDWSAWDDERVLEEVERLLLCMYMLARRSASDDCDDRERAELQKELALLRDLVDLAADHYHGGILHE